MTDRLAETGVTVILCARNEAALIANQLEALTRQDPGMPWEVIMVDNGSTDATVDIAMGFRERLEMRIVHEPKPGLVRARNTALAAARYPLIAQCDADDEVCEGWLAALVEALRESSMATGPLDEVTLNDPASRWPRPPLPQGEAPVSNRFRPFAIGANFAYRRTLHTALGGWCEAYRFGGGDDVDFCWRAQHAGHGLAFCPDAVVRYRHRATALGLARQFFRYGAADPLLYRHHARYGMQRESSERVYERWWKLLLDAPRSRVDRKERAEWLTTLSWSAGRIWGSIRHRSSFL